MAQLVEALHYKPEGRGFNSQWCQWNFSLTLSFRPYCGPGVDSTFNIYEYQEYFLGRGVKAACAKGCQPYHLHVPTVLKSGNLGLFESSVPVQAFTGIALPFAVCCALFADSNARTNRSLFAVILGRSHYLLFTLAAAMQPRMLVTFDEELNPLPVPVRVGLVSFTNCHLA